MWVKMLAIKRGLMGMQHFGRQVPPWPIKAQSLLTPGVLGLRPDRGLQATHTDFTSMAPRAEHGEFDFST